MHKNVLLWDIICYVALPLIIWHLLRDFLGDYLAMLLTSVPGIIYSVIRFIVLKKINFFGLYLLVTLTAGTVIDVLSGSAIQMLWNNVYYTYCLAAIYILTILINKPIYLYLSLDIVEMQGQDRAKMKQLFFGRKAFFVFQMITLGFAMRDIILATIKIALINKYGVDAFDAGIVLRQVLSWTFTIASAAGFIYIYNLIQNENPGSDPEIKKPI